MPGMFKSAAALVVVAGLALAPGALAADWDDKTVLTFSAPVMVPGATLQPGTYEFALVDPDSARHVVRITRSNGDVVTTTTAVPTKRARASEDVVIQFNPTDRGLPPAIKAWFYPGSQYGHEFIYPEDEAKQIAERTKTVVLSVDVPGSDVERGTLRTYDPSGTRAEWRGDPSLLTEWETWRRSRASSDTTAQERRAGSAPLVRGDFQGTRVQLDDLEENTAKYMGQTISVDGVVEEVLGPRLFTIDEPRWGDLDGEVIVAMPTTLIALLKEDDRVTITGTVKPFVRAELEKEWGWFGLEPEVELELKDKPVLVATRIVGGDNDAALVIESAPRAGQPVGTAGTAGGSQPMTDAGAVADGAEHLVGRLVALDGIRVTALAQGGGFFVDGPARDVFVLPATGTANVRVGDRLTVHGVILRMPDQMAPRLKGPGTVNDDIYVYAMQVGS